MEETSLLQTQFKVFMSKQQTLVAVKKAIAELLKANKRPDMAQISQDTVALASQNADNSDMLEAIQESSSMLMQAFYGPKLKICESIFFPSKPNEKRLIKYLKMADDYCYIALYTITNNSLSRVLYTLQDRGVDIRIITDDETAHNSGSDITALANAGLKVRVDPDPQARMHHKFVVIDDELLLNGSFNFTSTAVHKNNENVVAIDHPELIKDFKNEYLRLWDQNASGEIEGNGQVEKYLIEYRNRYKSKHGNRWNNNRRRHY